MSTTFLVYLTTNVVDANETGDALLIRICVVETPVTLAAKVPLRVWIKSPTEIKLFVEISESTLAGAVIVVEPIPIVALSSSLYFSNDVAVPTLLKTW